LHPAAKFYDAVVYRCAQQYRYQASAWGWTAHTSPNWLFNSEFRPLSL
jgi:hypothetical protein